MSRHQSAMVLEHPEVPDAAPGHGSRGHQDRRRQPGIVLPAAAIASVVVAVVATVAYAVSPNGSGAGNLSSALGGLQDSTSVTLLAQERQQIVVMNEAASTMSAAARPVVVSPAQIKAQQPQPKAVSTGTSGGGTSSSGDSSSSSSSGSSSSTGSGSAQMDSVPTGEATPEEAQQIAQELMPDYGFSVSSQWECLDEVWTQESGWEWDAENASGAYGIPQALPASKMAADGSDYMTDATTQIKWGLQYISSTYGTPCSAWDHEVNDGWY